MPLEVPHVSEALAQPYADKEAKYFAAARVEVLPLMPQRSNRVLEVGCGTGATLEMLKRSGRCLTTYGVEIVPRAAAEARARVDHVFEGDLEHLELPIEPASIDAILCLDVLEHMVDPWSAVSKLAALLAPGGVLIASIPNVQNYRVVLPLLRGRWNYASEGLLDKTHLRFFTRATAIDLMQCSGLVVDCVEPRGIFGRTLRAMNLMPMLRPFLHFQFLVRARNTSRSATNR
jgi:SAM-dependent methyltransferase